ncbi:MAG: 3-phosphoshikimate 1-carboxyvinyltransferase [Lachnospiraceae bacterium]|nr:3-phosphoshikimate 1-carboxyvinyltransferase [Lachnospiraceae bacterium]
MGKMRIKKYEAVIFDLDGTLLNTLEDLMDSVNYALSKYGMKERSYEEIRRFVGNGSRKLIERAVSEGAKEDEIRQVHDIFAEHYRTHCNGKTDLYPGIRQLLEGLAQLGVRTAIVSNKPQEAVQELYELYFKDFVQAAVGARDEVPRKPEPHMVQQALRELGIPGEQAVYVGDSEVDLATAANAGMECITVTWGFRNREELDRAGATVYADTPGRVMELATQELYVVPKIEKPEEIRVQVPGSKSITNRALLLAAASSRRCTLHGVLFSEDSRAFLCALESLGFSVRADEETKDVTIQGMGGKIPNQNAYIHVRSAGTAARFLTVFLAFAGGDYEMDASDQMCRRPMEPVLSLLKEAGVRFEFRGEEGHFPFRMRSEGIAVKEVRIDTGVSSQFASALLMAGAVLEDGLRVILSGTRKEGAYIKMTLAMMKQFGISVEWEENGALVRRNPDFGLEEYQIEPDVSAACYFYAMAPLLRTNVMVENVHGNSIQGDLRFVEAMERLGCRLTDTDGGIWLEGRGLLEYPGLTISMKEFSDQTMTMAALAPFAGTPTRILNVGHIRYQESDRISAIVSELTRMGIACRELPEEEGILIEPGEVKEAVVETYEDHRMAMAFTLAGLRTGRITVRNPGCCRKTFENYFDLIDRIAKAQSETMREVTV